MYRHLLITLILLLSAFRMEAQHLLGFAGSNYAGTNSIFLNPSSIADSRQGFYLNLFGAHATYANTYYYYSGPSVQTGDILQEIIFGGGSPEGILKSDGLFDRSLIEERLDGKPKMAHFGYDLRLPSFMLKLSPRHSIALTTRFRRNLQASNVSEDIARVIGLGTSNSALQNTPFTGSEAYFNANAFTEMGLTYALVLHSQEEHFLKGGFTVKRLAGHYSAHMLTPGADYQIAQNQEGESYVQVQQGSASFGFSRNEFEVRNGEILDAIIKRNSPGSGWGMDIGFTYEYRPRYADYQYTTDGKERTDHGENKYRYRVGVALLDIGSITYKDPQQVRAYNITRQNLNLDSYLFEDVDPENLGPTLEEALQVQPSEQKTEIISGLPTALHLNFDYRITRNLFINTAVLHNLRGKDAVAMHQPSALAVAPRLEGKRLELAMPVYLTNNYKDVNFGAMLRLGALVVGTNNLASMFQSNKAVGPDLYMGFGISIGTGGQRAKLEEKARKKANKEQRKANRSGTATPAPAATGTQNSTPVDSPANAPADSANVTPAGSQINAPADSSVNAPADSLTKAVTGQVKVSATDSLSSTVVKPLENTLPTSTPATAPTTAQPTPAIKPESSAVAKPENNNEATTTKPAGASETKATAKGSNN